MINLKLLITVLLVCRSLQNKISKNWCTKTFCEYLVNRALLRVCFVSKWAAGSLLSSHIKTISVALIGAETNRKLSGWYTLYGWFMIDVALMFQLDIIQVMFLRGLNACYELKIVYFSNFSQFRSEEDGGHQSSFFPNSKKSTLTRGEGQKSYGLVPQFGSYFYGSPNGSENINATFSLFFVSSLQVTMLYFPM